MRRALGLLIFALALMATGQFAFTVARGTNAEKSPPRTRAFDAHQITVTPLGPDQATIDKTKGDLLKNPALVVRLKGTRYRLVAFDFIDADLKATDTTEAPTQYRAQVFDYTNNKAYVAIGSFRDTRLQVSETQQQPNTSEEEFNEAVSILSRDKQIGAALHSMG